MNNKQYALFNGTTATEADVIRAYKIVTGKDTTEVTPDILNECKGLDAAINPAVHDNITTLKCTAENIKKGLEANGIEIICNTTDKGYLDGKLPNDNYFFIQVKNEHEANIRINDFGGFNTTIAATAVIKLLAQMSK